ncbi:hypothetical protein [Acaryochloris sp. CCMEE 5410]|uniref:hypothetical protein n=1 Tax=Acaryochloris sp. CCMEE 5410 TaxID=310037 RepID=UPI0002485318|nr:hypothetical protein [Acaryochloris sp. CCMEE 5410]KAI9133753.1 hypothetical protein ON05_010920 [Acaryochloris sp. CCMEE 5410]
MIISDLNYCEAVTEGLDKIAGGSFSKKVHLKFVVIKTFGKPVGNIAKAGATADAIGPGSFSEATTTTTTVAGYGSSSAASSTSVS